MQDWMQLRLASIHKISLLSTLAHLAVLLAPFLETTLRNCTLRPTTQTYQGGNEVLTGLSFLLMEVPSDNLFNYNVFRPHLANCGL